jgi:predicted dehydrogenase
VVGLADPDASARALVAPLAAGTPSFDALEAALAATAPEAVVVVSPPDLHAEHALTAIGHGCHVLVAKPLASDLGRARKMVRSADRAGVQLVVDQNLRWDPAAVAAARAARRLGSLTAVDVALFKAVDFDREPGEPRTARRNFRHVMEHPVILDLLIHHLDLLRVITGLDGMAVYAREHRPAWSWYDHGPTAAVTVELEGGVLAALTGSWVSRGAETPWTGTWRVQGERAALLWNGASIELARGGTWERSQRWERLPVPPYSPAGQARSLHEFLRSIRTGREAPTSGRRNLNSLALALGAARSAETGRRIDLSGPAE